MSHRLLLTALLSAALPALAQHPAGHDPHAHHRMGKSAEEPADPPSTDSLYNLTSTWTPLGGTAVPFAALRGRPVVLTMIYASCQAICPLLVSDARKIERALPEDVRGGVQFVVVTFDPKRDTVAVLREYAKRHQLDSGRWKVFRGDEEDVRDLAAVLGMRFRPTGTGDFVHTNLVTVLDAEGRIAHRQVGLGKPPEDAVAVLNRLVRGK